MAFFGSGASPEHQNRAAHSRQDGRLSLFFGLSTLVLFRINGFAERETVARLRLIAEL
jgi:hypothetical protein